MIDNDLMTVCGFLKKRLSEAETAPLVYDYGTVESCGDNVVNIKGLSGTHYGELLEFDNGAFGLALELRQNGVGAVLLGGDGVLPGSVAHGTGRIADVTVGEALLGRVIDPIGRPLDGKALKCTKYRKIESNAPTIMQRSAVGTPLETGILCIDSMIPIGRGQRELIIGDRQTGKTSIALSAMLNQSRKGVVCVYCAIGQKASTVAGVVHTLRKGGALENTVVVASTASETAAMQYLAPYAACAVAEEFMYAGRDVLVVYDDLSKHAAAYRTMSLLLRRPSGREAYPGDVFYLHSRLLERAAKLSDELGGGSMTALPIVETLAGDISAYIPTNVISITDGQIYLESELFNAGIRPAVNVGLSVSRVGRSAQSRAMKKLSGSLRLDVAQYRDMAVFAQFGADIDAATAELLKKGETLTQLLLQSAEEQYALSDEIAILLASEAGYFKGIPTAEVCDVRRALLDFLHKNARAALNEIDTGGELSDSRRKELCCRMDEYMTERGKLQNAEH